MEDNISNITWKILKTFSEEMLTIKSSQQEEKTQEEFLENKLLMVPV